jgi:hypothetical protein
MTSRIIPDDYTITHADRQAAIKGVLRLPTADAYDAVFATISKSVAEPLSSFELDVREVSFLNSSGIRALANLIMAARTAGSRLRIMGSVDVPWQKKTLTSLGVLYEGLTIQLV